MSQLGAVLDGGPFDGDDGLLEEPLPDSIWAFACPHGEGAACDFGGVHWARDKDRVPTCGAHEYVYSHADQADRHHYRFGGLLEDPSVGAHQEVPEVVSA
jgi:hypothetical protein